VPSSCNQPHPSLCLLKIHLISHLEDKNIIKLFTP
jgi:hypothetical protein